MSRNRNLKYRNPSSDGPLVLKEKQVTWKYGRPLVLCPMDGGESNPDRFNIRPGDQVPVMIFECNSCGHHWAIEVPRIQGPNGVAFEKRGAE